MKDAKNSFGNRERIKIFTVGDSFDTAIPEEKPQQPPAPPTPRTLHYQEQRHAIVTKICQEYCNYTTIHGVQYLGQERPLREKIMWVTVIIVSIFCCSNLTYNTYIKWCETPVIVSFSEKSTPVWNIPFPAVTICSETKSVKNENFDFTQFYRHLKTFKGKIYEKPSNMSSSDLNKMRSLLQICGNHLIEEMKFPDYEVTDFHAQLNQIVPDLDSTFPFCKWISRYGGCEEVFSRTMTEEGVCYTFNGLNASEIYRENTYQYVRYLNQTSANKRKFSTEWSLQNGFDYEAGIHTYPARVLGAGPRAGLLVTMQDFENHFDYICRGALEGFKVSLHSPDDIPQVSRHYIRVPFDKEIVVQVKPSMITTMNAISGYQPNRRQCFFNTERYLRFFQIYTQRNCELECLTNYTLSKCGCVKFSMPRNADMPVCDENKIHCYNLAEDDLLINEFTEGLTDSKAMTRGETKCNCLPSCTSLAYNTELSQGNFNIKQLLASNDANDYLADNPGVRVSRLSMYFKENQFITYKRSELFGMTDFVANCGGLFGLFMGFSVMSVVEFVYYLTLRLTTNIQQARRV